MKKAAEQGLRAHRLYPLLARLRDIVLASLALVAMTPFVPLLAIAARKTSGGSALFRQIRVGVDGKTFTVEKFRTLPVDAPSQVHKQSAEHLARPVGRFMRRFKLDELPQFWNVLKGEMRLVGPRPIIPAEYPEGDSPLRLAVPPGLTGLWQLSRVREQPFFKNPEYDLFYLANRSMAFDFWLIWRTLLLIFRGKETKIRQASKIWERNRAWRQLVPERARSIPQHKRPLWVRFRYLTGLAAAALLLAPGLAVALSARGNLVRAQDAMLGARRATSQLDVATANAQLGRADHEFAASRRKLESWPTLALRAIPGLNNNVRVPIAFASMGSSLVDVGRGGLQTLQALPTRNGRLVPPLREGVLDLAPFAAAQAPANELRRALVVARQELTRTPDSFLLPFVAKERDRAEGMVNQTLKEADDALGALFLLPRLFGAEGPRKWVIGAENNAELRGRGGYIGSLGTLSAEGGRLQLADFQPTSGLPMLPRDEQLQTSIDPEFAEQYFALDGTGAWPNLTMSPDFPTGARMLLSNLDSVAGIKADGLISLDPIALSYLLEATGPVVVAGMPEPLTSKNIVEWSLNKIYFSAGDNEERRELLSVIASTVWRRLLSDPNLNAPAAARALTRSLDERHLVVYSNHPDEQKVVEELGIGGSVAKTPYDYLLLVGQNVAENKMDYYLKRHIDYVGVLQDDGSLDVKVQTTVTNTAPPGTVLPRYISGTMPELTGGLTRDYMALFVPARAKLYAFEKGGKQSAQFENTSEKQKRRLGTYVEVGPGASETFTYRYQIANAFEDGFYRLTVQHQALVSPDTLSVQIKLPENTKVSGQQGFQTGRGLVWKGPLNQEIELAAQIETSLGTKVFGGLNNFLNKPVAGSAKLGRQ